MDLTARFGKTAAPSATRGSHMRTNAWRSGVAKDQPAQDLDLFKFCKRLPFADRGWSPGWSPHALPGRNP